jgi:uroporphyrinogen III methyltransferase / synthase
VTQSLPLSGRRVVVTRAVDQASKLAERLRALGASVVLAPTIQFEPIQFAMPGGLAWVVVTSPNGVAAIAGHDLGSAQLAVVGPGTAEAAIQAGFDVALVPPRAIGESLVEAFPSAGTIALGAPRVAVIQADIARPTVAGGLRAKGWDVVAIAAYRTLPVAPDPSVLSAVAAADAITFTSGSTVRSFVASYGVSKLPSRVISIGPVTSVTCAELGIAVTSQAHEHDVNGLVAAVVAALV